MKVQVSAPPPPTLVVEDEGGLTVRVDQGPSRTMVLDVAASTVSSVNGRTGVINGLAEVGGDGKLTAPVDAAKVTSGVLDPARIPDLSSQYAPAATAEVLLKPTGSASADAAAINTAMASMSAFGGGRVRLSGQAWTVSTSLTPRSGVTLSGAPGTTIAHTATSNIIYASGTTFTDFTVEGITFLGSVNQFPTVPTRARTTSGTGAQTAIFMSGDLDTTSTGQAQLTNFTMRNCAVKNCSALPIRIGGVRGKVSVTNCDFINNQDAGFLFCESVDFSHNYVSMGADNGVSLSRGCKKVTCVGNRIENVAYNGIWVAGFFSDKAPQNFTVTGNVIKSVGHNGIYCDYAPRYGAITGNSIDCGYYRGPSDQPTDLQGSGIYIGGYPITDRTAPTDWAQGISVTGNLIRAAARAGVYINGAKRITIIGNPISDIGTQYLADGATAISATDATTNVGVLVENATTSSDITVALNPVVDSRSPAYCNYGVVPQNTAGVYASLNNMVGLRNAFQLLETGPTRTYQHTAVFNQDVKLVGGATGGANAATGTVDGYRMNGAAGSARAFVWQTAGVTRWRLRTNGDAETGTGNAGSNFELVGYADNGTTVTTTPFTVQRSNGQTTWRGHRVSANSTATIAAAAQSASAAAASTGINDMNGTINTTAVASPAAGSIATVTYAGAYGAIPRVTLTARNAATVAAGLYVTAESVNGFTVATANTPAASASLSFHYHVEG
ncbi:right-handed parallel beta-helix repeat-containing protein [Streptomyces bauhiniae]